MSPRHRFALAALAAVTAAAATPPGALAVGYTWANPAGGAWDVPANWSPSTGAPVTYTGSATFNLGPSDPAAFAAYPGYTVTLPAHVDLDGAGYQNPLTVGTDKVTLTGHIVRGSKLLLATSAGQTAVLTLADGGGAVGEYGANIAAQGGRATVNVAAGGHLSLDHDDYLGSGPGSVGALNVSAGATAVTGNLYVGTGGGTGHVTVDGAGSKLQLGSDYTATPGGILVGDGFAGSVGTLDVTNGATVDAVAGILVGEHSSVTVAGAGSTATARFGFYINGSVTVAAGGAIANLTGRFGSSSLTVNPGGTLALAGGTATARDVTNTGTLTGSGTLAATNLHLDPASTLALSLTSPAAYDRLTGIGNVSFGGTLSLTADPSYAPQAGDSFDLLDFTTRNGTSTFSTLSLPPLPPGLTWDTSALYTTGALTVAIPEPTSLLTACTLALPLLRRRRTKS